MNFKNRPSWRGGWACTPAKNRHSSEPYRYDIGKVPVSEPYQYRIGKVLGWAYVIKTSLDVLITHEPPRPTENNPFDLLINIHPFKTTSTDADRSTQLQPKAPKTPKRAARTRSAYQAPKEPSR
ncbi:uncharacterized protein PGTG_05682 [Puccinia graminis f. sp. tritici CRL 75-36-700-3]|uniref:Uncharacterized protein n=1 Tax=Puccinia graminis f. sp. tritici (strain CRL 75-36-700-3 / race SCCL) TaxID=418459 RepID=E3K546_PUCGT|nr:uncharacterized protein PGTG_05682 [Puccinia graminis f. sp. tritici CRL 75-36-700-3]EFP79361.1 hypothetical protein PGTG_05682 [Puccinia graminis f. sp. tritici CRL 75-36-700-3]